MPLYEGLICDLFFGTLLQSLPGNCCSTTKFTNIFSFQHFFNHVLTTVTNDLFLVVIFGKMYLVD